MPQRPEDLNSSPVSESLETNSGLSRRTVLKGGLLGATGILAAG